MYQAGMPGYPPMYPWQPNPAMLQQIQTQPQNLYGRTVNDIAEVTAQDVLQNGTPCWFPSADGSKVWRKICAPSGMIETSVYVIDMQKENITGNDRIAVIESKLDSILNAISSKGDEDGE